MPIFFMFCSFALHSKNLVQEEKVFIKLGHELFRNSVKRQIHFVPSCVHFKDEGKVCKVREYYSN